MKERNGITTVPNMKLKDAVLYSIAEGYITLDSFQYNRAKESKFIIAGENGTEFLLRDIGKEVCAAITTNDNGERVALIWNKNDLCEWLVTDEIMAFEMCSVSGGHFQIITANSISYYFDC